jgi:hypothetical protein
MAIPREDFESIVHAHQAMLYRIAFNFFRNVHTAEEVVQDVLQHPLDDSKTEELRKLVGGLKSIQIRGVELEGTVGPSLAAYRSKIQPIRDLLKAPLWVRYAANTSGDSEMEIWSGRSGIAPTGVILLSVTGGKQVFIMNVAGDLRPDQLIYLSGVLGIPSFNLGIGKH